MSETSPEVQAVEATEPPVAPPDVPPVTQPLPPVSDDMADVLRAEADERAADPSKVIYREAVAGRGGESFDYGSKPTS